MGLCAVCGLLGMGVIVCGAVRCGADFGVRMVDACAALGDLVCDLRGWSECVMLGFATWSTALGDGEQA
jgi:hypothetical protein